MMQSSMITVGELSSFLLYAAYATVSLSGKWSGLIKWYICKWSGLIVVSGVVSLSGKWSGLIEW